MLARHVHTVLVVLKAYYARVLVALLAHQRCLYFASVCLVGPEFEDQLVSKLIVLACLPFVRESLPGPIGCPHVFQVVLVVDGENSRVEVAQVLVIWEIQYVTLLPAHRDLIVFRNFDHIALRRSFYYFQCQDAVHEVGLELIRPHLYDHVLNIIKNTCVIWTFSMILMKVPVVLPVSLMKNLLSLNFISAWNRDML